MQIYYYFLNQQIKLRLFWEYVKNNGDYSVY